MQRLHWWCADVKRASKALAPRVTRDLARSPAPPPHTHPPTHPPTPPPHTHTTPPRPPPPTPPPTHPSQQQQRNVLAMCICRPGLAKVQRLSTSMYVPSHLLSSLPPLSAARTLNSPQLLSRLALRCPYLLTLPPTLRPCPDTVGAATAAARNGALAAGLLPGSGPPLPLPLPRLPWLNRCFIIQKNWEMAASTCGAGCCSREGGGGGGGRASVTLHAALAAR